jgi:hypothetical protein
MVKKKKYHYGIARQIIAITGYSEAYISQVLNRKVPVNGKKAKRILELADRIHNMMELAIEINRD